MSILVKGASVESVSYSPLIARTTLSTALAGCFPPARNSVYLITVVTGVFVNHSLSILCDISPHAATHIVLGREWGALFPSARLQTSLISPPNSSHLTPIDLIQGRLPTTVALKDMAFALFSMLLAASDTALLNEHLRQFDSMQGGADPDDDDPNMCLQVELLEAVLNFHFGSKSSRPPWSQLFPVASRIRTPPPS
ncbi:hypothetical protein FB451DRAFT_1498234 [Mycena latifolia]|nr:hypothetical protein FB451DRAFT_1498234 [Mycena latifolia]